MIHRLRKIQNQEGFTLIELLIVVIILAILAAIVVFAVGNFTTTSRRNACKTDFRSVQTAQEAYKASSSNGSYAANTTALVNGNYLKEDVGTGNGYSIATGSDGGVTVTVTGDGTGTTSAQCGSVS